MSSKCPDPLAAIHSLLGWHKHPRNGKIARLPEATRNLINQMLDDGFPYRAIREKLRSLTPPLPYPISDMNLSNWCHGGYQDYHRQQLLNDVLTHSGPSPQPASQPGNCARTVTGR